MERLYYDLHIHSCLSPCGDVDMTPNNIVNMARLKGLDVIAVTDHNAIANGKAAAHCETAQNLIVLFGAEVETAEEVHVVCLFEKETQAEAFFRELLPTYPDRKNNPEIFGKQILCNEKDQIIGEEERLLMTASELNFTQLFQLVQRHGGAFVPAHIDRDSYSVYSNLGEIPQEIPIGTVEISRNGWKKGFYRKNRQTLLHFNVLTSSDAHYLWDISEKENYFELEEKSAAAVMKYLRR